MRSSLRNFALAMSFTIGSIAGVANAKPQLNGVAVYEELGQERFIAALYTETASRDPHQLVFADEPKAMEMRFVDDRIHPRQLKRLWIEGAAINAGQKELEQFSESLAQFGNMLTVKMRAGDIVRIERGEKVDVRINGYLVGSIEDPTFFDLLLRTWVGPVPPAGKFKEDLLLAGDVPDAVSRRFAQIEPSRERVAAVARALDRAKLAEAAPPPPMEALPPKTKLAIVPPATDRKPLPEPAPKPQVAEVAPALPAPAPTAEPLPAIATEMAADDDVLDREDTELLTAERLLAEQVYISMISKWTQKHIKYPRMAVKHNQEGVVQVTLTLAPNGEVQDMEFRVPSDHDALNKAARKAVFDASPYPDVPAELATNEFKVNMPVVFLLN